MAFRTRRMATTRGASLVRTPDWMFDAACRDVEDPDMFFPEWSGHLILPRGSRYAQHQASCGLCRARAVCGECPVSRECLRDALRDEEGRSRMSRFGIRAGLTPEQRWELATGKTRRGRTA